LPLKTILNNFDEVSKAHLIKKSSPCNSFRKKSFTMLVNYFYAD
jgi:hypothetical protein